MRAYPAPSPGALPGEYFASRDRRAQTRAVADAVDRLLTARRFDPAAIAWMLNRARFADAARLIQGECRTPTAVAKALEVLLDRHARRIKVFRLALAFAAYELGGSTVVHDEFTIATLRKTARGKNQRRARGAREALAALGRIKWRSASRRERAAFALAELCRLHLERAE